MLEADEAVAAAPLPAGLDDAALDTAHTGALARVPWFAGFLRERTAEPRYGFADWPGEQAYRELRARKEAAWAEAGERLAGSEEAERRAAVVAVLATTLLTGPDSGPSRALVAALLPTVEGWTAAEVAVLLRRACTRPDAFLGEQDVALALDAAERLDLDGCRAIAPWLERVHASAGTLVGDGRRRARLLTRLRALLSRVDGVVVPGVLIPAEAAWAAPLRERVHTTPTPEFATLTNHLAGLSGPRPTQKWRRECRQLAVGASALGLVAEALRALAEDEPLCSRRSGPHDAHMGSDFHYHYLVRQDDGDLARGLVWAAALTGGAAAVPHLASLALRVGVRGSGVFEDPKLAGAAINALADVEDESALEALWRLQVRIKHRALRKQVDTALITAAGRLGITPEQLVERSVPDHGLAPDGSFDRVLTSGHRLRLSIEEGTAVRLTYTTPDGRTSRTAPAAVKEQGAAELAQFKALAKEVRATLAGERVRIEALLSTDRTWPYADWRRHYRDHSITGSLARGLIWEFSDTDSADGTDADGTWHTCAPGEAPGTLPAGQAGPAARVRLWHPIRASEAEITAWRERIVTDRLHQPFKQAFREVHLLTPADQETGGHSNRFAGHIVHYPRLYALLKERGWQANYLCHHDGGHDGRAHAEFADGTWRAWFHHEPAETDFVDSPDQARTGQVRFDRRVGRAWQPASLPDVPAHVLSEAMRDVDLFVSVTSVTSDSEAAG
ncbi:hypothetical protein ABH931_004360 [Streptacidiphilus sp. MAP12-33]|uniref:DUF4132 domain-containing protein n=1 Tax=Streptacidiphilus sp. MAP12-33 TaxID=3156266 RepID=UPI0035139FA7